MRTSSSSKQADDIGGVGTAVPSRRAQDVALREEMTRLLDAGQGKRVVDTLLGLLNASRDDVDRLSVRVEHLARLAYGRRSEKLTKQELHQLVLAFGGTEDEASVEDPQVPAPRPDASLCDDGKPRKSQRNHPGRTRLSDQLERKVALTTVPQDARACQQCGKEMAAFGHQDHERIEYVPAQIVVHVERREKLGCKACRGDAVTAERKQPAALVGRADASVLARLIGAKCEDSQPIARQADQLRRLGWHVPANTLYGYWKHGIDLLEPVAHVVQSKVLGGYVVGIDDTLLNFLDEADGAKRRRGHLWAFANAGGMIAYAFTRTWEAAEVAPWMHTAEHFIQVDDYKGYSAQVAHPDGGMVTLVPPERRLGCGMHIRRRFEKALKAKDGRAGPVMELFRRIYEVERKAKGLTPEERLAIRTEHSVPLVDELDTWVHLQKNKMRPTELLEVARGYMEQQSAYYRRCFSDGRFEIDNGDVERGMRRIAIGRRNWLFAGASTGAPRLAVAYTLVESCRRLGLPVYPYLIDVLQKLDAGWPMRRIAELTPEAWGIERGLLPLR